MKKKLFITAVILGVFLMIDIPMLMAQSTGTSSSRSSSRAETRSREATRATVVIPPVPDVEMIELGSWDHGYAYTTGSSDRNSKLSLSKRYEGVTAKKKGTFHVDEGVKKIRISVSGRVESGKINLEIYLPDGKDAGKFQIDDTADLHWSQSIGIEEDETKYYGDWTFVIQTEDAHGRYELSLSTY